MYTKDNIRVLIHDYVAPVIAQKLDWDGFTATPRDAGLATEDLLRFIWPKVEKLDLTNDKQVVRLIGSHAQCLYNQVAAVLQKGSFPHYMARA